MSGGGGAPAEEPSGGKKNSFGEEAPASVELNLTALMDILSNLLFFLLASFGATIVMAINGAVPVQSAEKSDVADTGQSVTVNVKLSKEGLDVQATGNKQTEEELQSLRRKFPPKGDQQDFEGMTAHLLVIKGKYPKSDTMILTPEPGMPYDQMIKTMDAARETTVKTNGEAKLVHMFPTVVVTTLFK